VEGSEQESHPSSVWVICFHNQILSCLVLRVLSVSPGFLVIILEKLILF
jgi:hypothetical protein